MKKITLAEYAKISKSSNEYCMLKLAENAFGEEFIENLVTVKIVDKMAKLKFIAFAMNQVYDDRVAMKLHKGLEKLYDLKENKHLSFISKIFIFLLKRRRFKLSDLLAIEADKAGAKKEELIKKIINQLDLMLEANTDFRYWPDPEPEKYLKIKQVPYLEELVKDLKGSGISKDEILKGWEETLAYKGSPQEMPESIAGWELSKLFKTASYYQLKQHYVALLELVNN